MSIKRLSWAQFEVANPDKEVAFEDLYPIQKRKQMKHR